MSARRLYPLDAARGTHDARTMSVTTGWVAPIATKAGQDHLAVQAPCVALYTHLIPGITNVSDRARCYSLYPWLLRAIEHRHGPHLDHLIPMLRRAECLYTLVAARHAHSDELGDREDGVHGPALVGRERLLPALHGLEEDGEAIDLAPYATSEESALRYFKSRFGALGQYYLGPLRDIGVLGGDGRNGPRYTVERGVPLADAFAAGVDEALFFDTLDRPALTLEMLDALAAFCPCRLRDNPTEASALLDLFFDRRGEHGPTGQQRRTSLLLVLDLVAKGFVAPGAVIEDSFRGAVYSGASAEGTRWVLPPHLAAAGQAWATYVRNELLSIAVQGIFWVALTAVVRRSAKRTAPDIAAIGSLVGAIAREALGLAASRPFGEAVDAGARELPGLGAWQHDDHEVQLGWRIEQTARSSEGHEDDLRAVLRDCVALLVALAARPHPPLPYRGFDLADDYLDNYPINLQSLALHAAETWRSLPLDELAAWVATRWGVETHLRVALRKMRFEAKETFQVRPDDDGLFVVAAPPPVFTAPRFRTSVQILRDLNLLGLDDQGERWVVTEDGAALFEALR